MNEEMVSSKMELTTQHGAMSKKAQEKKIGTYILEKLSNWRHSYFKCKHP
jgi:hypothetical protein